MKTRINKKRLALMSCLAAATAVGGMMTGMALARDTAETEVDRVIVYVEKAVQAESRTSLGEFVITAYCPCDVCCGKYADGITASGTIATEGRTCAVDPTVIPLGTEIEIAGVKYVAEDVGGAIKGNRIDICFNDHKSAVNYGVRNEEVYVND